MIPFRRFGALVLIVTAFTVAHSITLIAAASGLAPDALWFSPLVETLIAASILYMALENIAGATSVQRRWIIAFAFGLVHGFGFSFALRETLQFAGSHLVTSLLAFNVGVELGQLLVLAAARAGAAAAVPVRGRRADRHDHPVGAGRAHRPGTGRGAMEQLRAVRLAGAVACRPLAGALRWLMLAVVVAAVVWLIDPSPRAGKRPPAVDYAPDRHGRLANAV